MNVLSYSFMLNGDDISFKLPTVDTVTAILERDADGTLHLPIPLELGSGKLRVVATLEPVTDTRKIKSSASRRLPKATPEMIAKRMAALKGLRAAGGFKDVIPDPSLWQREIREDRTLPGRD